MARAGWKPQTPRDPTGTSPDLTTDPRAVKCEKHQLLLYPGEICGHCRDERLDEQFAIRPVGEELFDLDLS